jgi:hypothetical protein
LSPYSLFLPAAFAFAQRALADAAIFALEAALIFRLAFFAAGFVDRFDSACQTLHAGALRNFRSWNPISVKSPTMTNSQVAGQRNLLYFASF